MRNTIRISRTELVEMLTNWNYGAQPVTIQYATSPKINKQGKTLFGDILKLGAVNCMLSFSYENSVNRRLDKEDKEADFKAKPIWNGKGEHVNQRIIRHIDTGALYLQYKFQKQLKALHFDSVLNFIPDAVLRPYFYKSSRPANQGVSEGNEIIVRTLKIENIKRLKMKKQTFQVV